MFLYPVYKNEHRVIDGDTIEVTVDRGWWGWKLLHLRLHGVDAPESRTRDLQQKEAGLLVKRLVEEWIETRIAEGHQLHVTSEVKPKYAKRAIGHVLAGGFLDGPCERPHDLASFLSDLGVVKPYEGGRRSWTGEELAEIVARCKAELGEAGA